ncbi:MAG: transglutaminase domain-containing protein [Eubacterium sp.]
MKKVLVVLKGIIAASVVCFMVVTLAFTVKIYSKVESLEEKISKEAEGLSEDGNVLIGGQYEIIDTSQISDAYINNDSSGLNAQDKETLQMASDILDEIITDDMTLYDKELAVHDWMAENIKFEDGSMSAFPEASKYCDRPYGALKFGYGMCVGYATTFKLFMNMLGVEDLNIVYDTDKSHSWDQIKLDDDEWYYVDVTFDSKSSNGFVGHQNFNVNDETLSNDHSWERAAWPSSNGVQYNYAVVNCTESASIYDLPKTLYDMIQDGKSSQIYVKVPDANESDISLLTESISYRLMDAYLSSSCIETDDEQIFTLTYTVFSDYDNDDVNSVETTVDEDKLEKIITKLFGEVIDYDYSNYTSYKEVDGTDYIEYETTADGAVG